MSTRRWAGAGVGLLVASFVAAGGCGSDNPPTDSSDGGCSKTVTVNGCNTVHQNGADFSLGCSKLVSGLVSGHQVCAGSGACINGCLDPATVYSCLNDCNGNKADGGGRGDGGPDPLGTKCTSDADCTSGLTCVKPTDNVAPGAGPPNGLCTVECSAPTGQDLCDSLGGICVGFSNATTKAFCLDGCSVGSSTAAAAKCHGRLDTACESLTTPGLAACVPLCGTDADCGTRKCDIASGFCTDVVGQGAPLGSACSTDKECASTFCYPFVLSDAASSPGSCTALCRLGNGEACGFRTSALDAGPAVGACLLATKDAAEGDLGLCAELCDTVDDCGTVDTRWTCIPDADVNQIFGHAGYCWLGTRPDGGTRDAGSETSEAGGPEAGVPETSTPETGTPESGAEAGSDATAPDASADGASE